MEILRNCGSSLSLEISRRFEPNGPVPLLESGHDQEVLRVYGSPYFASALLRLAARAFEGLLTGVSDEGRSDPSHDTDSFDATACVYSAIAR